MVNSIERLRTPPTKTVLTVQLRLYVLNGVLSFSFHHESAPSMILYSSSFGMSFSTLAIKFVRSFFGKFSAAFGILVDFLSVVLPVFFIASINRSFIARNPFVVNLISLSGMAFLPLICGVIMARSAQRIDTFSLSFMAN